MKLIIWLKEERANYMEKDIDKKRLEEEEIIKKMIEVYCKKKHRKHSHIGKNGLCKDCEELFLYAKERIDHCPMMATKTFCSDCKIHCYKKEMREKIRIIMRFSGPRMLYYHPVLAIKHVIVTVKGKRKS